MTHCILRSMSLMSGKAQEFEDPIKHNETCVILDLEPHADK